MIARDSVSVRYKSFFDTTNQQLSSGSVGSIRSGDLIRISLKSLTGGARIDRQRLDAAACKSYIASCFVVLCGGWQLSGSSSLVRLGIHHGGIWWQWVVRNSREKISSPSSKSNSDSNSNSIKHHMCFNVFLFHARSMFLFNVQCSFNARSIVLTRIPGIREGST